MNPHFAHYGEGSSYRISDAEREAAMAALGRAFADGRLSIEEYDERVQKVAAAQFDAELPPLFEDLPASQAIALPGLAPAILFSSDEIDAARQNGRHTRFGIFGLSTVGAIVATAATDMIFQHPAAGLFMFVIPVVWLMLYVLRVGPDRWYTPSPRQLQRQRMRELRNAAKMRSLEQRSAEQDRLAAIRMQRRQQTGELTNRALGYVNRALDDKGIHSRNKKEPRI